MDYSLNKAIRAYKTFIINSAKEDVPFGIVSGADSVELGYKFSISCIEYMYLCNLMEKYGDTENIIYDYLVSIDEENKSIIINSENISKVFKQNNIESLLYIHNYYNIYKNYEYIILYAIVERFPLEVLETYINKYFIKDDKSLYEFRLKCIYITSVFRHLELRKLDECVKSKNLVIHFIDNIIDTLCVGIFKDEITLSMIKDINQQYLIELIELIRTNDTLKKYVLVFYQYPKLYDIVKKYNIDSIEDLDYLSDIVY